MTALLTKDERETVDFVSRGFEQVPWHLVEKLLKIIDRLAPPTDQPLDLNQYHMNIFRWLIPGVVYYPRLPALHAKSADELIAAGYVFRDGHDPDFLRVTEAGKLAYVEAALNHVAVQPSPQPLPSSFWYKITVRYPYGRRDSFVMEAPPDVANNIEALDCAIDAKARAIFGKSAKVDEWTMIPPPNPPVETEVPHPFPTLDEELASMGQKRSYSDKGQFVQTSFAKVLAEPVETVKSLPDGLEYGYDRDWHHANQVIRHICKPRKQATAEAGVLRDHIVAICNPRGRHLAQRDAYPEEWTVVDCPDCAMRNAQPSVKLTDAQWKLLKRLSIGPANYDTYRTQWGTLKKLMHLGYAKTPGGYRSDAVITTKGLTILKTR